MVSATRPRARVAARVAYAKPVVGLGAGKSLRVARRAASSLRVSAAAEDAEAIKKGEENEEEVPASASSSASAAASRPRISGRSAFSSPSP